MGYVNDAEVNPYRAPAADVGYKSSREKFAGYAGFWRRFAAAFIDGIIVNVASLGIGMAAGVIAVATQTPVERLTAVAQLLAVILSLGYVAGMTSSSTQATLGKMALGIKITDLRGRRIGFGRALGRELAKIPSALILMIGFIMAAFTERKQALHDLIAGTLVVQVK